MKEDRLKLSFFGVTVTFFELPRINSKYLCTTIATMQLENSVTVHEKLQPDGHHRVLIAISTGVSPYFQSSYRAVFMGFATSKTDTIERKN